MVFYISKLFWVLLQPSTFAFVILLLGLLFLPFRVTQRLGRRLRRLAAGVLVILGFLPIGHWLLQPLENRFPSHQSMERVDGIILLGGSFRTGLSADRNHIELNETAERITEAIALAHRHPNAKLLFTGGNAEILGGRVTEAALAEQMFNQAGVSRERLLLEARARNTFENAIFAKTLAQPKEGEIWLLVTSARHMPRSVAVFRQAGFDAIAWPVDYETDESAFSFSPLSSLMLFDAAFHEWVGLFAYRLLGWSSELFPS